MATLKKFLKTTKNKVKSTALNGKSKCQLDRELLEEFEQRKQQWQEDVVNMADFLILKSTEEQRAEGIEFPVDTALIEDRDGLPVLKAIFDIRHFRPSDVTLTVEQVGGGDVAATNGMVTSQRQLVLLAQCLDDSRECSVFKKTMIRRVDLPDFVETRWMHCRLETPSSSSSSDRDATSADTMLVIELPFHLPPQRRRPGGPGVIPIQTESNGCRVIRFAVPIDPDFTADDITLDVDRASRQVLVSASYEAEIGHYGTEVTRRCLERVFRLPDVSLEWDSVVHHLDPDGRLHIEIRLVPSGPYKYNQSVEAIQLAPVAAGAADDDELPETEKGDDLLCADVAESWQDQAEPSLGVGGTVTTKLNLSSLYR